ncbi:MAG: hypothetical protein E7Z91_00965 [Cyanobacteria bacterium SIG30]|nr:hypothetical protein [Cyanobacteria bacterium SIG30]
MITNVSFTSVFNPEKTYRRHVEGKLINPESDVENLHAQHGQPTNQFGKIGTQPTEKLDSLGKLNQQEIFFVPIGDFLGRSQVNRTNSKKEMSIFDSKSVDCTSLYSKQELECILDKFKDTKKIPIGSDYEVTFYSDLDRLVISHGEGLRNFTTVIFDDGSAMQIGCMNEQEVAKAGTCLDIIEDVKKRINQ